ncbi:unnamed protein product [Angiostrongylus costaricensis]|uniref:Neur_chan_memb domain-containing protein n=1 Tax=Angiostrongylus costaricensis TaxID=334426 RepID=A0A0R3PMB0_ANGCS|nr:unnamed protein product [Angiostrongylus costaricensis]
MLSSTIYVLCIVHLLNTSHELNGPKIIGTLIATIVMSGDEFKTALAKSDGDNGSSIADLVIFRVALGVVSLVLAIEMYVYIRLYLHLKAVRQIPSR